MINKQKSISSESNEQKYNISNFKQLWKKNNIICRGMRSPSKLLKYNYKHSMDRIQQKSMQKHRLSQSFIPTNEQGNHIKTDFPQHQQKQQEEQKQLIISLQKKTLQNKQDSSKGKNIACNSQILFQQNYIQFRKRSISFCKSLGENQDKDKKIYGHSRFQKRSSQKYIQKQKQNNVNPYTKGQYLYVRNQSKDVELKKRVSNQNKFNFGKNIEKSCKIVSFVLVNPLQKYQKMQKMHKTNSTLPECYFEQEEQNISKLKLESKQMPISHRKKTAAYFKNQKWIQNNSNKANCSPKIVPPQNQFLPSPWESSVKNCDIFYLKVQQL